MQNHDDDEQYAMDYAEFQTHVDATDATVIRTGDISVAEGWVYGRECVIGEYNHATGMATLYCV